MRRVYLLLAAAAFLGAGSAGAATISATLTTDNSGCNNGTSNNTSESTVCSNNGSSTFDDWGAAWSTTNGVSTAISGIGSGSATFRIDGVAAADDGGADVGQGDDRWVQAALSFNITLQIDVEGPAPDWTVDLGQSIAGLYGLNGDGTLSAVGTQDNGMGEVTTIITTVDSTNYNWSATPTSYSNNPSNTSSASQVISGSRNDNTVLSGTGDALSLIHI